MWQSDVCDTRFEMFQYLGQFDSNPRATQMKTQILQDMGTCYMLKGKYKDAKMRYENALSEAGAPEDVLMKNIQAAPMVLFRDAAQSLNKGLLSHAGTALRRIATIYTKEFTKMIKTAAKQNNFPIDTPEKYNMFMQQAQNNPMVGMLKNLNWVVNKILTEVDVLDDESKTISKRLATSDTMYLSALPTDLFVDSERLIFASSITDKHDEMSSELADAKAATFLKRGVKQDDCEKYPVACEVFTSIAEFSANPFGETRIVNVGKKKKKFEMCETNGNLGVLYVASGTVKLQVGDGEQEFSEGDVTGFNFCNASSVSSADGAVAVFAQGWHPEVAALERTHAIRERSSSFKLSEDQVKAITKLANTHAKKSWDKTARIFRTFLSFKP